MNATTTAKPLGNAPASSYARNEPSRSTSGAVPTVSADIFGSVLTLNFSNGQELSLNASDLNSELQNYAMLHGLKQKLVDAAAIKRNPITGGSATVADKYDAVREIYDRLISGGTWNKIREGGAAPKTGGLLVMALMELKGISKEKALAFLENKTAEHKKALRNHSKIKNIIENLQLKLHKNDPSIDTDSMLDELGDSEPVQEPVAKSTGKKSGKKSVVDGIEPATF